MPETFMPFTLTLPNAFPELAAMSKTPTSAMTATMAIAASAGRLVSKRSLNVIFAAWLEVRRERWALERLVRAARAAYEEPLERLPEDVRPVAREYEEKRAVERVPCVRAPGVAVALRFVGFLAGALREEPGLLFCVLSSIGCVNLLFA